jgi:hypothetical protein
MKIAALEAHTKLGQLLARLPAPLAGTYFAFHQKHQAAMLAMPASVSKHHAWSGGYAVHIYEVTRNLVSRWETAVFPEGKKPGIAATIIAAYIHDLDKLFWRYEVDTEKPTQAQADYARKLGIPYWEHETKSTISKKIDAAKNGLPPPAVADLSVHCYRKDTLAMDDAAAVACLTMEHQLPGITPEIMHAVSLHHGGWAPLAKAGTVTMQPLAVLLHAADMESSQIQNGETA